MKSSHKRPWRARDDGLYWLYRNSEKENGNYYNGLYRDYQVYIEVNTGIVETRMETTI